MSGDAQSSPISTAARKCIQLFESLTDLSSLWDVPIHGIDHAQVLDHYGQLRIWASNVGALQPRAVTSSLDYRLREAPKFAAEVVSLLEDLAETLEDVYAIVSGEREDRAGSLLSSGSEASDDDSVVSSTRISALPTTADDNEMTTSESLGKISEVEELFRSIPEMISMLFKLSVIIRNSSSRDRFAKAQTASSRSPVDPAYDINYVKEKFPSLQYPGMEWLATRLGKTITQRRQFMWYCRDHREKMAKADERHPVSTMAREPGADDVERLLKTRQNLPIQRMDDSQTQSSRQEKSTLAQTTASTVLPTRLEDAVNALDALETTSGDMDNQSVTSFASSVGEGDESSRLSVILLEDIATPGKNFECPYCWTIQKFNSQRSWKKHVMADLKPYICTAEECNMKMFTDSRTWLTHEMQSHLVCWQCCFCSLPPFNKADDFTQHISRSHEIQLGGSQLSNLLSTCKRPLEQLLPSACRICDTWDATLRALNHTPDHEVLVITPQQLRRHVGNHLEQLALFAIPPSVPEGETGESDCMAQDGASQSSSDRSPSNMEGVGHSWKLPIFASVGDANAQQLKESMEELMLEGESSNNEGVNAEMMGNLLAAAAANKSHGRDLMSQVLKMEGAEAFIDEGLLEIAAANDFSGLEVMELLLEHVPNHDLVTHRVLEIASRNLQGGKELLTLLVQSYMKSWESINSLLLWAASKGLLMVVDVCLELGTRIDTFDYGSLGPLMLAVRNGHEAVVQLLLEAGAVVGAAGLEGATPLSLAALQGQLGIIRLLLANGADVEAGSPLHDAIENGDEDCIDVLMAAGASIDASNDLGQTPLMMAVRHGRVAIIDRLLKAGAAIEARDVGGRQALWYAIGSQSPDIIQRFLEEGSDIEARDGMGWTPLAYAATKGHEAAIPILLAAGSNPQVRDEDGRTPLRLAVERGYMAIANVLSGRVAEQPQDSLVSSPASISLHDLRMAALDSSFVQAGDDWHVIRNPQVPRTLDLTCVGNSKHEGSVTCVAFSRDGRYVATGSNEMAEILQVPTGTRVCTFSLRVLDTRLRAACFSYDGRLLATGDDDGWIQIWDMGSKSILTQFSGHSSRVLALDFSPDGSTVVSCGSDHTLRIWGLQPSDCKITFKIPNALGAACLSPVTHNFVAAACMDYAWNIWDASTGRLIEQSDDVGAHKDEIRAITFSSDGRYIFSSSWDQTVKMWELSAASPGGVAGSGKARMLRTFGGYKGVVESITLSPDSKLMITRSRAKEVMLWDTMSGIQLALIVAHSDWVMGVAMSPDGRHFATASLDTTMRIWSFEKHEGT